MVSALVSILVLGLLVIVHELGHFIVARWAGVRILRFSVGFGPRLLTWRRGHTEYAVSAIPLGGYVKMAGEQSSEQAYQPWEYLSKPLGVRALIVFAGPFVNYIVALVSLWVVFVIGYPELSPVVGKILEHTPAQTAGLQIGDRIRAINGEQLRTWDEMTKRIHDAPDQSLTMQVERRGTSQSMVITPKPKKIIDPFGRQRNVGLIGVAPSGAFELFRVPPIEAISRTIHQQNEWIVQTILGLWAMATGKVSVRESVTGPIGIVFLTSEAVRMGIAPLMFLVALFSLNLAIFNVFPIPILDGGHLLFLLLEKLRGRPVSVNVQERSAQVSFVLLVTLVLIVCANDVSRFELVDKLFGWVKR